MNNPIVDHASLMSLFVLLEYHIELRERGLQRQKPF